MSQFARFWKSKAYDTYPLIALMGASGTIGALYGIRLLIQSPDMHSGYRKTYLQNQEELPEDEKYYEHAIRKHSRQRSYEVFPSLNKVIGEKAPAAGLNIF